MKNTILLASLLLCISVTAATQKRSAKYKKTEPKSQLGTSFKFDGTSLRGKYQTSLGTNATVEDDKYLDDLLGGRKSFNDRTQEDKKRN